jgi:hypothetical protein
MEFLLVPGSTSKFNNKYFYPCQKFFLLPPHPDLSPPLRRRGEKRKRLLVNVIYIYLISTDMVRFFTAPCRVVIHPLGVQGDKRHVF